MKTPSKGSHHSDGQLLTGAEGTDTGVVNRPTRRGFLAAAGGAIGAVTLLQPGVASAQPHREVDGLELAIVTTDESLTSDGIRATSVVLESGRSLAAVLDGFPADWVVSPGDIVAIEPASGRAVPHVTSVRSGDRVDFFAVSSDTPEGESTPIASYGPVPSN